MGTAGCLYSGPTLIKFGAPSATKMTVWSPDSVSATTSAVCGGNAPNGAVVDIPNNNVIYVQGTSSAATGTCDSSVAANQLKAKTLNGMYPQTGDYTYRFGEYGCTDGDLWTYGTVTGRVTLGAESDIRVVDNLTVAGGSASPGTNVIGLVANRNVEIYHPICDPNINYNGCVDNANLPLPTTNAVFTNPTVNAAILSVADSFVVPLWGYGSALGTLHIWGSIAQEYRGPVGTNNGSGVATGYAKDYQYDQRLRYAPPPFYLNPSTSAYGIFTFAEVKNPTNY
ncbi:MAG: hypothetical protein JO074_01130 [Frankiales bacterium]|nr:hypothetical protein [Frankiales bacterium]